MTLKSAPCFQELADNLKEHAGRGVLIELVNGGNWGDALIQAGQRVFFEAHKIPYIRIPTKPRGQFWKMRKSRSLRPVAVFSGGGALVPWWDRYAQLVTASEGYHRTIILPSTLGMELNLKSKHTDIWIRDFDVSPQFAAKHRFCHDMAFFLDPAEREVTQDSGMFFRTDAETVTRGLPAGNNDISAQGLHDSDHEVFLDVVGACKTVYTDRLHVGISGALLGRETHIFPSKGGKTRAIFEASIKGNYPHVTFHDEGPKEFGIDLV